MNALHPPRATRRRHAQRGFTLIELMITVAIVAILARVAMPSYLEYVKRGKMVEGFNGLSSFSLTMGQWYQDNRTYAGACTAGTMAALPATTANFSYACSSLTATTYLVTATGQNSLAGFSFTLDQNGTRTTTSPATSGWPSSTTCWISNKSGTCY